MGNIKNWCVLATKQETTEILETRQNTNDHKTLSKNCIYWNVIYCNSLFLHIDWRRSSDRNISYKVASAEKYSFFSNHQETNSQN